MVFLWVFDTTSTYKSIQIAQRLEVCIVWAFFRLCREFMCALGWLYCFLLISMSINTYILCLHAARSLHNNASLSNWRTTKQPARNRTATKWRRDVNSLGVETARFPRMEHYIHHNRQREAKLKRIVSRKSFTPKQTHGAKYWRCHLRVIEFRYSHIELNWKHPSNTVQCSKVEECA